jgi:hypothetical protein
MGIREYGAVRKEMEKQSNKEKEKNHQRKVAQSLSISTWETSLKSPCYCK